MYPSDMPGAGWIRPQATYIYVQTRPSATMRCSLMIDESPCARQAKP